MIKYHHRPYLLISLLLGALISQAPTTLAKSEEDLKISNNETSSNTTWKQVEVVDDEIMGSKVKKVPISNVEYRANPKLVNSTESLHKDHWKRSLDHEYSEIIEILYSKSNIDANTAPKSISNIRDGLANALIQAYQDHADVVISPDDMWISICLGISVHIDKNAEKLRHLFVDHEGKKEMINIMSSGDMKHENWPVILEEFQRLLTAEVKGDFASKMTADFSTTGHVEKMVSIVSLMTSMKQYFRYIMLACGIRNVYFTGTLQDWQKLRSKLEILENLAVPEIWYQRLVYVVDNFIETYKGNVNVDFWDKMYDNEDGRGGSGKSIYPKMTGWILAFFPYNNEDKVVRGYLSQDYVPVMGFEAPFKYADGKGETHELHFLAGFSGIRFEREAYRPQLSYAVAHKKKKPNSDKRVECHGDDL